jgi:hypothetical protein
MRENFKSKNIKQGFHCNFISVIVGGVGSSRNGNS